MSMPLYGNVAPVLVQGYGATFRNLYAIDGGLLERVEPGAFSDVGPCFATFDHAPDQAFARTQDSTLRLFEDGFGLGFEARLPATWGALGLVRGITSGTFRQASVCFDHGTKVVQVVENGRTVNVVKSARLREISIVAGGANDRTAMWIDAEDPADLPEHLRQIRAWWRVGLAQHRLAARAARTARAQARARAAHQAPVSVRAILARGKPPGWMSIPEAVARGLLPS
jgi:HK97 family phage prohead protease